MKNKDKAKLQYEEFYKLQADLIGDSSYKTFNTLNAFSYFSDFILEKDKKVFFDFEVYLDILKAPLQRPFVWSEENKKEFILNIIKEINYIPPITMIDVQTLSEKEKRFLVIDGKQRLSTIKDFILNKFSIQINNKEIYYKDIEYPFNSLCSSKIVFNVYYDYRLVKDPLQKNELERKLINLFLLCNHKGVPVDENHLKTLESYL